MIKNENRVLELKKAISRLTSLKYLVLTILIVGITAIAAYDSETKTWSFEGVWSSALQGLFLTSIVAVFFDLFIRKEQKLEQNLDRESLLAELSPQLIKRLDIGSLSKDDASLLLNKLMQAEFFLDALSQNLVNNQNIPSNQGRSYLAPFKLGIHLESASLKSKLIDLPSSPDNYIWKMEHEFKINDSENVVNIIVSRDVAVVNAVLSSQFRCDHLVLLSNYVTYNLIDFVDKKLHVNYQESKNGSWIKGNVDKLITSSASPNSIFKVIPAVFGKRGKIKNYLDIDDDVELIHLECRVPDIGENHRIKIAYEQILSLKDPYFYNASTSYVLAKDIQIDYSGIKSKIGEVSALSFVSASQAQLTHDKNVGELKLNVDGLLQPGEGALIIWRTP